MRVLVSVLLVSVHLYFGWNDALSKTFLDPKLFEGLIIFDIMFLPLCGVFRIWSWLCRVTCFDSFLVSRNKHVFAMFCILFFAF